MRFKKQTLLPLIISLIFFLIPFFWLKPGEMDLGGDSSRLYFYNPLSYLLSSTLYGITASGFGSENINYVAFPFISFLAIIRHFLSPTVTISIFHGLSLSMAFLFSFLSIKEIIKGNRDKLSLIETYASIVGGLTYSLSPALIDGWEHVLLTHDQIFLNPLMFYLLLRFFKTSNSAYIVLATLVTFIFSHNFSVIAAPPVFAFYPMSILFIIAYTKIILKRKIALKPLIFGFILFLGLQSFHLIPQISSIFSSGTSINLTIFSDDSKFIRGLDYFLAVAPSVKASINLLAFPQGTMPGNFSWIFFVFPFIILSSYFFNKQKTLLLLTFFFLITLFFATGNVTKTGLNFYANLFNIPGFSMFRNFYGQWQYVYIFFYALLFALSLSIVISKLKRKYVGILTIILIIILVANASSFLRGDVIRRYLWQSNNVSSVLKMDPQYEKILSYIHSLPLDGKILTLPLTDPSYQLIAGVNGGAYEGPSTISYLAGRKDFPGYAEFAQYNSLILNLLKSGDFETFKEILGVLNIKYVFYNADPKVYDSFPGFSYQYVRGYLPIDQTGYRELVDKLSLKEIKNIDNKFFVYEVPDKYFLPKLYVPTRMISSTAKKDVNVPIYFDSSDNRTAFFNPLEIKGYPIKFNDPYIEVKNNSSFLDFFKNSEDSRLGWAFVSQSPKSILYPIVVWRENQSFSKLKVIDDFYIDRAIFFAEKRINELVAYGDDMSLIKNVKSIDELNNTWKEPNLINAIVFGKYNYWETNLVRFQRSIYDLIDKIESPNNSTYSQITNKALVKRQMFLYKKRLIDYIRNSRFSNPEKIYINDLTLKMFDSIYKRLDLQIPSPQTITYQVDGLAKGDYDLFIEKSGIKDFSSNWEIVADGQKISSQNIKEGTDWLDYSPLNIENSKTQYIDFQIKNPKNLLSDASWDLVENKTADSGLTNLSVENIKALNTNGLITYISHLNPKSYYILSFDYLTYGKNFKLGWYEKDIQGKVLGSDVAVGDNFLDSTSWKNYKTILVSGDYSNSAYIQITKDIKNPLIDDITPELPSNKINIKNLSLVQMPTPRIFLRKISTESSKDNLPNVKFTRINATKYIIDISNVKNPFMLIFANAFNNKWKLVDTKANAKGVKGEIARIIGYLGGKLGGISAQKNPVITNTVQNYYNGEISQGKINDFFLNGNTFETWGKNEVSQLTHFPSSYANAWYITPKDLGGKSQETLILEMSTQKLFYLGLFISFLILAVNLFLLIWLIIKNR